MAHTLAALVRRIPANVPDLCGALSGACAVMHYANRCEGQRVIATDVVNDACRAVNAIAVALGCPDRCALNAILGGLGVPDPDTAADIADSLPRDVWGLSDRVRAEYVRAVLAAAKPTPLFPA